MFTETTFPAISLFLVFNASADQGFLGGRAITEFLHRNCLIRDELEIIYIQLIRDVSREQSFISAVAYEAFDNRGNF